MCTSGWQAIVTKFIRGLFLNFSYSCLLIDTKRSARIPKDVEMPWRERQTDRQTVTHGESLLVLRPEGNQPSLWTGTSCDSHSCDTRTLSHPEAADTMQMQFLPVGSSAGSLGSLRVVGCRQLGGRGNPTPQ